MDWMPYLVDVVIALATGIGLWLLLPRGVVLTKELVAPDTWRIVNDSALPVRLTSVRVKGAFDGGAQWHELPNEVAAASDEHLAVDLRLDDWMEDTMRGEWGRRWDEVDVGPGNSLSAQLANNTTLRIRYRRSGWSGVAERREVTIHGFA